MTLDRWIALIILLICLCYGYQAFFIMDLGLPPFMQRNPVWPSTFPKLLAVMGIVVSAAILLGLEKSDQTPAEGDINYRALGQYKTGQALALLSLMVAYAVLLRAAGFFIFDNRIFDPWGRSFGRAEVSIPDSDRRSGCWVCLVFGTGCFGNFSTPVAFFSGNRISA
jgi:hypothetical protein